MTTHLMTDDGVEQRSRRIALMVSTSVFAWAEAAGLEFVDGHMMLALSSMSGPVDAIDISACSSLPLDTVYPSLHRLTDRGYAYERHRRHALTDRGAEMITEFDERYWPRASLALGNA